MEIIKWFAFFNGLLHHATPPSVTDTKSGFLEALSPQKQVGRFSRSIESGSDNGGVFVMYLYIHVSLPEGGRAADAFQSLFSHIDGKYCPSIRLICDMRPVLIPRWDVVKKTHYRSGGTGVRTRDLPNAKWRAWRLATVLGVMYLRV
jgi:hypothetical protein